MPDVAMAKGASMDPGDMAVPAPYNDLEVPICYQRYLEEGAIELGLERPKPPSLTCEDRGAVSEAATLTR
jgi:hypothetical protein